MPIELLVQSGPDDDPRTERFEEPVITIGRDPSSTLRFDMSTALEVSTRHAEIREQDGAYVIIDRESTNGTWLNGARLRGLRALNPGDVINLGRAGPELRVVAVGRMVWHPTVKSKVKLPPIHPNPSWRPRHRTEERLANLVHSHTRTLKLAVAASVAGVLGLALVGWLYVRTLAADDPDVWREVTAPAIRKANDDAVVLIETEIPGPTCARGCEGTGFSITTDGLIVTNRHVVIQRGVRATKIYVKFANTRGWVPASLVRAAREGIDLALIQVLQPGRYPAVGGVSASGPDLPVGSAVMSIGFPAGTVLKMEGDGSTAIARTTVTIGSIGKVLPDVFQIDVFADHGSSGSPVFDRHGHAIGVVSGGARGDTDKIVYVVPSTLIWELKRALSVP